MSGSEDRAFQGLIEDLQSGALSYEDARRRYMELGDKIRERYEKEMTALSVDVVDSHKLKQSGTPLEAQATFDAYHRWVGEKLEDYGCVDATWAGDGLMALFDRPEQAVAVGRALLDGLPAFNSTANRIRGASMRLHAIQVRIGIHTGPVLTDPTVLGKQIGLVGRIASDTIDLAGHLQKSAAVNQMSISPTTYSKLGEGAGQFAKVQREMPNPGTCFVYPPRSDQDNSAYTGAVSSAARPPGSHAAAPARGGASPLPWIAVSLSTLAVGAVVAIAFMLSHLNQQDGGTTGPSPRPLVLQPRPAAATNQSATPPVASSGATPVAATPPAVTGASPQNAGTGASPENAGPEPSRQLWTSPDAASGLPARVVQSPPAARWLLSIGVGSYRDRALSAEGAAGDARLAAQILQRSAEVPAGHVQVLTDEQATLRGIRLAFETLQQNAITGKDTVLVYLAGAGVDAPDRTDSPHRGGASYAFAPYDANSQDLPGSAVYGSDIAAWLAATRSQAVIVFADTSFAGAMECPSRTDQGRQYALVAAVGAGQRAGEGRGPQGSAFVESLAQALSGAADGNRDRQIALDELQQFLRSDVPRRTGGAQNPDIHAGFGGYLPEFRFVAGG